MCVCDRMQCNVLEKSAVVWCGVAAIDKRRRRWYRCLRHVTADDRKARLLDSWEWKSGRRFALPTPAVVSPLLPGLVSSLKPQAGSRRLSISFFLLYISFFSIVCFLFLAHDSFFYDNRKENVAKYAIFYVTSNAGSRLNIYLKREKKQVVYY